MSAISRDYGVTPPAISYIVKNTPPSDSVSAAAEPAAQPVEPQPAEPRPAEPLPAAAAPAEPDDDAAPGEADAERGPDSPAETAGSGTGAAAASWDAASTEDAYAGAAEQHFSDPLALRLYEAARSCCRLVEAGEADRDKGESEALGQAMHEVRRALVAIELDASRRQRKPRPASAPATAAATRPRDPDTAIGHDTDAETPQAFGRAANDEAGGYFSGTVKFYRPDKGFGFVTPDDGSSDVYIPSKILEALGIDRLHKGQRVQVRRRQGAKGPEVESLRLLAG